MNQITDGLKWIERAFADRQKIIDNCNAMVSKQVEGMHEGNAIKITFFATPEAAIKLVDMNQESLNEARQIIAEWVEAFEYMQAEIERGEGGKIAG